MYARRTNNLSDADFCGSVLHDSGEGFTKLLKDVRTVFGSHLKVDEDEGPTNASHFDGTPIGCQQFREVVNQGHLPVAAWDSLRGA